MYNEKPQTDFLPIIFLFSEAIFVIIIIAVLSNLLKTDDITTEFISQPVASVTNLRTAIPELSAEMADTVERQLYTAVLDNSPSSSIANSATTASVVENSIKRNSFDKRGGVTLISAAIDVPAVQQSYSFFYGYPEAGNNNFQTFYTVLCPVRDDVGTYPDFDCRILSPGDVNKETILASFLSYFDFDYFSAYLDGENSHKIIIGPSITYNNDSKTKNAYIAELKTAIDALGLDPDEYEYYVRTAADITYENTDR